MRFSWLAGIGLCSTLLFGCVSESTIVDSKVPGERPTDNKQIARTRLSLGLNYLQRGETSQARFNLEKARELAPDMPEVDNALAYYYQQVGEFDQAEDAYRDALRKDHNNADTYNNFGAFLCQINKFEEAEELLLAAVKRPGYIRVADSYENLAFCALGRKDFDKYQQYLEQALRHNGVKHSIVYNLSVLNYAKGDLEKARIWQKRLQELGQVSPQATLLRYMIAYQLDDKTEQQTAEKFMLSVYPTTPETAWMLSADFSASAPEKLRQQYKASLLGLDPADLAAKPAATPKIKVVKRKTGVNPDSEAFSLTTETGPQLMETTRAPAASEAAAVVTATAAPVANEPSVATVPTAPAETTAVTATTETTAQAPATHKVQYGETLFRIASKYRLSVSELQRLNQLADPGDLKAGQVLRLSDAQQIPREYQALDGDTLFSIAYKFNLALAQLAAWNQLPADAALHPGQTILLHDPTGPGL
ncbi:MAG: type IV pilus biogenesis/stability protein PilW [Rheinheimera sp.]|nr:MAG: type IV pilus biogenesis/stability protein PilW [Rheinheimera sp.]